MEFGAGFVVWGLGSMLRGCAGWSQQFRRPPTDVPFKGFFPRKSDTHMLFCYWYDHIMWLISLTETLFSNSR